MRVGLVIYGSLDTVSGGYLYDRQLVSYLESTGDQVELVSIPVHNYSRSLLDNFSASLYRRLAGLQVDVLLQDELNHPSLWYMNRRILGSVEYPVFSIVHHLRSSESNPEWRRMVISAIERSYLESVDGFIFNSENTRLATQSMVRSLESGVVAYPAGNRLNPDITRERIKIRAVQEGSIKILFLGNVIPRKGLHVLMAALNKINLQNWHLSVVGSLEFDRMYAQRILQLVEDYNFQEHVVFHGVLDDMQLGEIMLNNHILAVPSYHEGFGIAYLEGMGFGLPAIGTTSGGASEIITHGEDGYLIPHEDVSLLAECISGLIQDRELLIDMSLQARTRYLRHPTWENSMERVRTFLVENIS
jgi:glycosyltransferase involved in cell wall biosynthesis